MVTHQMPIYHRHLNPESQTEIVFCFYFSFSDIDKKDSNVYFMDVLQQEGLLGTHINESIFADKANYYIGQSQYIQYTTSENKGVYQLADKELPSTHFKIPIGARLNFYINEYARTYYRYYQDNWEFRHIQHRLSSIKISSVSLLILCSVIIPKRLQIILLPMKTFFNGEVLYF
jgi:hypothetical protein